MPLQSKHFTEPFQGQNKLERCLVSDPDHVVPGAQGEHVAKIQEALIILGAGVIEAWELKGKIYGPTTARTVLAFKGPPRYIININYQRKPDNIVGRFTIKALDEEMLKWEKQTPPPPVPFSLYVALTELGQLPHDHDKCPLEPNGKVIVQHLGTPIYPKGTGRKINIGGEGETKYLGFEDFVTDSNAGGPPRPLTSTLPDKCASDICLRSSPITRVGKTEIVRIAQPACRLTYASDGFTLRGLRPFLISLGVVPEDGICYTASGQEDVHYLVTGMR